MFRPPPTPPHNEHFKQTQTSTLVNACCIPPLLLPHQVLLYAPRQVREYVHFIDPAWGDSGREEPPAYELVQVQGRVVALSDMRQNQDKPGLWFEVFVEVRGLLLGWVACIDLLVLPINNSCGYLGPLQSVPTYHLSPWLLRPQP